MKNFWQLILLLIFLIFTIGCSMISSSTSSSSNPSSSVNLTYKEIANSKFCVGYEGNHPYITFEPPLVKDPKYITYGGLSLPIESGKYRITVTTDTPEGNVYVSITWPKFVGNDKFGNPMYEGVGYSSGYSDRKSDFNTEVLIPDSSHGGTIQIVDAQTIDQNHNCGRIIVKQLMV